MNSEVITEKDKGKKKEIIKDFCSVTATRFVHGVTAQATRFA